MPYLLDKKDIGYVLDLKGRTWRDRTCFKRASEHIMRSPLILCHLAYKPQISGPYPLPFLTICISKITLNRASLIACTTYLLHDLYLKSKDY